MPSITVSDNITFEYIDSGDICDVNYSTFIIIHGHSFHSRVFERLFPHARSQRMRLICVNRRGYPGSTPYTDEELAVINGVNEEQHTAFLLHQGTLLALFIDGIIQKHSLSQESGIALVAWSMGNVYAVCMLAALGNLPADTKSRLASYIHTYIAWDFPYVAIGEPIPGDAYLPLWGEGHSHGDVDNVFGIWVSGYFIHGSDMEVRDFKQLNQRNFQLQPSPSLSRMTVDEIKSMTCIIEGEKYDTPLARPGGFENSIRMLAEKVLHDTPVRKEWTRLKICSMLCENTVWTCVYGVWKLQDIGEESGIKFKIVSDANHFLMYDDPERCLTIFKECASD